jgi:hypothetical protein
MTLRIGQFFVCLLGCNLSWVLDMALLRYLVIVALTCIRCWQPGQTAFNFQNSNFGKGGTGNDRVTVSVQDAVGTNNADFTTPPEYA